MIGRPLPRVCFRLILSWGLAAAVSGCAGFLPGSRQPGTPAAPGLSPEAHPFHPLPTPARQFAPPSELDRVLDAHSPPLPAIAPAMVQTSDAANNAGSAEEAAPEAGGYCVQVGAIANLDSAQARKAELEKTLGENIDMSFDPPYYKLRLGNFATRREAEDKLVDLEGKSIHGFIVRQ